MKLHRIYSRSRFIEREYRGKLFRLLGLRRKVWAHGLFDEFQFWERVLLNEGRDPQSIFYRERIDPSARFQQTFRDLIAAPPGAIVKVLDVGAGPLTNLGKVWEDRTVEITAVDALAQRFDEILKKARIAPLVRTRVAYAEKLSQEFSPNTFDFSHARNSLDHALDPIEAIRQMVHVVKPGGHVYLWHVARVGEEENYKGLHQWNFDCVDGEFVVGNGKKNVRIREEVEADVTCSLVDNYVIAILKKR